MGFLIYWAPWCVQRTWRAAVVSAVVGALVVWFERWLIAPADTFWGLAIGLAVNLIMSAILSLGALRPTALPTKVVPLIRGTGLLLTGAKLLVGVLIPIALWAASGGLFRSSDYYQMGRVSVQSSPTDALAETDIHAIVVVPEETAKNKARQVIGQYGSQFQLGKFYLQRYKEQLVYVAVLEPTSLFTQWSAGVSPGYVLVSATDETAPAQLVTGYKIKYTEQGYWNQWVNRVVRSRYPTAVLGEFSFELDEQGKPWWVGSGAHYEVGMVAARVDQAIVVNPETGESQSYKLSEVPEWMDQVIPESLAASYTTWWGKYGSGFWNAVFTQRNVKVITNVATGQHLMAGVNGKNGHFYYFSGMTSSNGKDTSLIGYMLVDGRSGTMIFQQVPGISSEENIVKVVQNEFKAQRYVSGYPLPYNIYGHFTWVVPVLDSTENGQFMSVALVSADATTIASGKTMTDALRQYKVRMTGKKGPGPTEQAAATKLSGVVERVAQATDQGSSIFYLVMTDRPGKVFTAPLSISPHLAVTKPGDHVVLEYSETNELMVPVTTFHNQDLEK
jgi:hypothetical protein